MPNENKGFGQIGGTRRTAGFIMIMICAISAFLSGFGFYNIETPVIWAEGVVGLSLLVSGIAKDVVALAKNVAK